MEEFLHSVGHVLALIVEAIALFIIAVGTVEALFQMVRAIAIRTFLSYFLDREVERTRRLQPERGTERAA